MYKFILVIPILFSLFCSSTYADELNQAKIDALDELMTLTEAETNFRVAISTGTTTQLRTILKAKKPNISEKTMEIIEGVVVRVFEEEIIENGAFRNAMYLVYHKHFELQEVRQLIEIYKTPLGQKVIRVMPLVMREGIQIGQTLGAALGPTLDERIRAKLKKEKIDPIL